MSIMTADNIICEAYSCNLVADTEVHLNAGTKGILTIYLCAKCRSKLHFDETFGNLSKEHE
jgi:hypothetical protein